MKNLIASLCKLLEVGKDDIHQMKILPAVGEKDEVAYLSFKGMYNKKYVNATIYSNGNFYLYLKHKAGTDTEGNSIYDEEYIYDVEEFKVILNSRKTSNAMNLSDYTSTRKPAKKTTEKVIAKQAEEIAIEDIPF